MGGLTYPQGLLDKEERINTPLRVERFWKEWAGKNDFKFTTFKNPGYDQLILLKNIDFASVCSHHLLPFIGKAHIGYIPNGRICGISKLARVLDKFASRPQLQERMTQQIADFIQKELKPKGVMVIIEGEHMCMRIRGVKKTGATMTTSAIKGVFKKKEPREEFLALIGRD